MNEYIKGEVQKLKVRTEFLGDKYMSKEDFLKNFDYLDLAMPGSTYMNTLKTRFKTAITFSTTFYIKSSNRFLDGHFIITDFDTIVNALSKDKILFSRQGEDYRLSNYGITWMCYQKEGVTIAE